MFETIKGLFVDSMLFGNEMSCPVDCKVFFKKSLFNALLEETDVDEESVDFFLSSHGKELLQNGVYTIFFRSSETSIKVAIDDNDRGPGKFVVVLSFRTNQVLEELPPETIIA